MRTVIFAAAALLAATTMARADTLAITNARILTAGPQGEISSGTVVVTNGKISAVGANVAVPSGARVIDAGHESGGLAVVAAEMQHRDASIVRGDPVEQCGRVVLAAVVDEYEFPTLAERIEGVAHARVQGRNVLRLVV